MEIGHSLGMEEGVISPHKKEGKESLRDRLLATCEELQHDWKVIDTWLTRDTYQDGTHKEFANNKKRTAWFTSVFHLAEQAIKSPLLDVTQKEQLQASTRELRQLFKQRQQEGMDSYINEAVPHVQEFFQEHGVDIDLGIASMVAVQLAKDPSGHLASQTLLIAAARDPQLQVFCDHFSIVEVQVSPKVNYLQKQSPDLAAALATAAKEKDIIGVRETMGHSQGLVDAGDALLAQIASVLTMH